MNQQVSGIVQAGYRVASGMTENSPYPKGTIAMQTPIFRKLGLDLSAFFPGTLNICIHPAQFELRSSDYTFRNVRWAAGFPAEDFSFSACSVTRQQSSFNGFIYYPHPETKIGHFQDSSIVEVIAPLIPELNYGDRVTVLMNSDQIHLIQP